MKFLIVRRRVLGVAIPKEKLRDVQPVRAEIIISECRNEDLGRSSVSAQLFKTNSDPDIPRHCWTSGSQAWPRTV